MRTGGELAVIDRSQDRYFLILYGEREKWRVIDREKTNHIKLRQDGSPYMFGAVCIESAKTLSGMLCKLWMSGDETVYVRMDWVSSRGTTRRRRYPHYYNELNQLTGYVEDVCEISMGVKNNSEKENWRVEFAGDMWMMTDESTLSRVSGFDTLMREAVDDYIKEEGLTYDVGALNPW